MSFWLFGRKRKQHRHLYSVTVSIPLLILLGVVLLEMLRQLLLLF